MAVASFLFMSPEEFERLQLQANNVFCRRCGLTEELAVPMDHVGTAFLDEYDGPAGVGSYHVYKCPRCGHRGMSEQIEVAP